MQTLKSPTPSHLLQELGQKPVTKPQLMSYLASLQVYGEFQVEEARRSNVSAEHPFHTDQGKEALNAEFSLIQDVFLGVQRDLRNHRITLQTHEMRRVGNIVGDVHFNFEKALATYQMPLQAQSGGNN